MLSTQIWDSNVHSQKYFLLQCISAPKSDSKYLTNVLLREGVFLNLFKVTVSKLIAKMSSYNYEELNEKEISVREALARNSPHHTGIAVRFFSV